MDKKDQALLQQMKDNSPLRLTIISPVFNEECVISLFFDRIVPVIQNLRERYEVHLLFLNNASTDSTYQEIENLRRLYDFIYVISLSRNVGYQRSLDCGLHNVKSDLITFIDVDCEDPPEMILEFVGFYEQGYDIVYGERIDRDESNVIKFFRKLFYHIVHQLADEDIILYMAEFSLITSEVKDAIIDNSDSFPFIRGAIARVGFQRIGIPYKRHQRIAGKTHYNIFGMTVFAIAGILSSTTLPLRLSIYFLPFWLFLITIFGLAQIFTASPWFSLINTLLICSYLGYTVSFIALYVARGYKNSLGQPNYFIHQRYSHLQP